jgi:hypothetical protein
MKIETYISKIKNTSSSLNEGEYKDIKYLNLKFKLKKHSDKFYLLREDFRCLKQGNIEECIGFIKTLI